MAAPTCHTISFQVKHKIITVYENISVYVVGQGKKREKGEGGEKGNEERQREKKE